MDGERHVLIPDGLFGLQYPSDACFFALELDMGTEQHKECDRKSVTLRQKFRGYRTIMRERLVTSHFGLPSLHVLMVTPGFVRKRNMTDHVARVFEGDAEGLSRAFLFKAVPPLVRASSDKPPVTGHMLTIYWDRPEYPQLNLAQLASKIRVKCEHRHKTTCRARSRSRRNSHHDLLPFGRIRLWSVW
jgi:hypothetical protein